MVSLIQYGNGASSTYAGLSTDSKPEISENGSAFIEMDTSKKFMFDAAGEQWIEQASEGGGGSGASELFVVNITYDTEEDHYIADKTIAEAMAAVEAGMLVVVRETEMGDTAFATYAGDSIFTWLYCSLTPGDDPATLDITRFVWRTAPFGEAILYLSATFTADSNG